MLTKISMWFYKKHEKQMRHCNIYFVTLFTVSVSGPVRSFLCQQYTPPLRCVRTSRVCARTSARASARTSARTSTRASARASTRASARTSARTSTRTSARTSTRASARASTRNTSSNCCWLTETSH